MDYYINFALHRGDDFGNALVEWHEDAKVLEFGDAPYNFYEWVDDHFGDSEDDTAPRIQFLDAFYNALHQRIDELGMKDNLHFLLEVQGLTFDIDISKETSEPYILEDLHQSINDIFEQYDEGRIDREEANEIAKRCALAFVATLEDVAE